MSLHRLAGVRQKAHQVAKNHGTLQSSPLRPSLGKEPFISASSLFHTHKCVEQESLATGEDEHGLPTYDGYVWDETMDVRRTTEGNDTPWLGRRARTHKHYVIPSDPKDDIPPDGLRRLATRWAREGFPDLQVAIVYHDGNEGHAPHAHVIVNNTTLSLRYAARLPAVAPCSACAARNVPPAPFARPGLSPGRSLLLPWGRIRASPGSQAHITAACLQDMDSYGQTVVPPVCPYESSCPRSRSGEGAPRD